MKSQFFRNTDLNDLENIWKLPVVFSFVCNTGDFDRSGGDHCFAEKAITVGSPDIPTGAVAVVGPSDKDTDTKLNNPMYGTIMDALLEHRVPELAPALHAGKQCLIKEFGDLLHQDEFWCKNVRGKNFEEYWDYPLSWECISRYP